MIVTNQSNIKFNNVLPDNSKTPQSIDSNIVSTEILNTLVVLLKTASSIFILENGKVKQTTVITNGSTALLKDVNFKEFISEGAAFLEGSLKINSVSYPAYNPVVGFSLPNIATLATVQIEYELKAPAKMTNPSVDTNSKIDYTVTDPLAGDANFSAISNTLTLPIESISLTVIKSVNKAFAISNTRLYYTTIITNIGTTLMSDLVFTDIIPSGTNFVSGTVKINGTLQPDANPTTGFALADMTAGAITTVEFETVVS